jgi:hypothetical protein
MLGLLLVFITVADRAKVDGRSKNRSILPGETGRMLKDHEATGARPVPRALSDLMQSSGQQEIAPESIS